MNERDRDEQLLIDFALGRCDPAGSEEVNRRLASEEGFAALHRDISNALAALGTCPVPDPPEDLADRTIGRIAAARRTEALLAAQPAGPDVRRSLFSFRELGTLAAAVILAVGILLPSLRTARQQAHRALCADNVRAIHTAMSHYANGSGGYLPSTGAEADTWLFQPGQKCASNSAGLFLLVREKCAVPNVFQCPAAGGRPFVVRAKMIDFPSPRSLGYSYQYSLKGPIRINDPDLAAVAEEMVILADATPVFADGKFQRDRVHRAVSENHSATGQNVLDLSGRVRWVTHAAVGVNGNNIWLAEGIYDYRGTERPVSPTDSFLLPHPGRWDEALEP